jgi:hypothetical protein
MKVNEAIIIAGSGRSGTTWVLDTLARSNGLRTIFEPLHPIVGQTAAKFAYRYIRVDANESALKDFMDGVFTGRLHNLWVNYRIRKDRLKPTVAMLMSFHESYMLYVRYRKLLRHIFRYPHQRSNRVIVKCIRANLMLGWLYRQYHSKILFIMRHPGAVLESKMRLEAQGWDDWNVKPLLARYARDTQLVEDIPSEFQRMLKSVSNPVAEHTLVWCIENSLPLRDATKRNYCLVYYEHLLLHPEREWKRIIDTLGLPMQPDEELLKLPSQQTSFEKRHSVFDRERIGQWMACLSKDELLEINTVLEAFAMAEYDAFDPLPRCERYS